MTETMWQPQGIGSAWQNIERERLAREYERAQAAANRWAEAMWAAEDAHAAAKKAFIEASNKASATAFNLYEEKPR